MPPASAPPRPASPLPTAKVRAKIVPTSMPRPPATRPSSTAALSRLPKRVFGEHELQSEREQAADDDDEEPIDADARTEKVDPARQARRQIDDLLVGAHQIIDHGGRHEDEADRKQYLIEMALVVEMHIERAFEQKRRGRQRRRKPRAGSRRKKCPTDWS